MFKMSYFRAEGGRHCVVGRGRKEGEGVGKGREGEDRKGQVLERMWRK